jgi:hypothetical protein
MVSVLACSFSMLEDNTAILVDDPVLFMLLSCLISAA